MDPEIVEEAKEKSDVIEVDKGEFWHQWIDFKRSTINLDFDDCRKDMKQRKG